METEERKIEREGKALSSAQSDHQRWRQSRASSGGNGIQIGGREFGLAQGGLEDGANVLKVLTGGQFGDDSAVDGMGFDLRGDSIGNDAVVPENGDAGFVATGFEGEQVQSVPELNLRELCAAGYFFAILSAELLTRCR